MKPWIKHACPKCGHQWSSKFPLSMCTECDWVGIN